MKVCPECGHKSFWDTDSFGLKNGKHCQHCDSKYEYEDLLEQEYILMTDKYDKEKKIVEHEDYIEARGGDGTLLKAITNFRKYKKPFLGVAGGTLNFLMNKSSKIKKKAKYKKFNLIKVKVTYLRTHGDERTETTGEYQAFNDVLFGGDMNSWIEFDVHDRDHIIGKFKGGGVAISTTQGTTGFNVNNGGAILPLSSKQWFITSAFANRRIRVPIKPKRTSITAESRTPVSVWVDGQNNVIRNVKKIEISKGDEVTIIFNNYSEFKRKRRV